MKIKDLIEELQTVVANNPEMAEAEVILARDSEGNGFGPISEASIAKYEAESTWSGEVYPFEITDAMVEDGYDKEADAAPASAVDVIVLWPVN